jgi:hypothetical protein
LGSSQRLEGILDGHDLPILNVLLKMAIFGLYRPLYFFTFPHFEYTNHSAPISIIAFFTENKNITCRLLNVHESFSKTGYFGTKNKAFLAFLTPFHFILRMKFVATFAIDLIFRNRMYFLNGTTAGSPNLATIHTVTNFEVGKK